MSSLRRPPGPVRQLSLQQPPRRQQVRRQRSAEDEKPLQIYANPIRAKLCPVQKSDSERPRVRIAWGDHDSSGNQVQVIARQLPGKPRPPAKPTKFSSRNLPHEKATILYSRQELAERLRLAWKQREDNRSNLDIFLAHNTVEERSESQMSTSTSIAAPRTPAPRVEKNLAKEDERPVPSIMVNNKPICTIDQTDYQQSESINSERDANHAIETSIDTRSDEIMDMGFVRSTEETTSFIECKTLASNYLEEEVTDSVGKEVTEILSSNNLDDHRLETIMGTTKDETNEDNPRELKISEVDVFTTEELIEVVETVVREKSCMSIRCSSDATMFLPASLNSPKQDSTRITLDKDLSQAKIKRANFHDCTNKAFVAPPVEKSGTKEKMLKDNISERTTSSRRTSSAPPQRRSTSAPGPRTQVNIVIDATGIARADPSSQEGKLLERKDTVSGTTCNEAPVKTAISNRAIKSAPMKRRAKSGKRRIAINSKDGEEDQERPRRATGSRVKQTLEKKSTDVITMVSLVSSADSDSDIDRISPRDDKLIYELRNKLPTTPIIKNSCCQPIATSRKPIKSVSFQQDSFDDEEEVTKDEKKLLQPRYTFVYRGTGSALPTPEEASIWRSEVGTTLSTAELNGDDKETTEILVTDREKRCLAVPIGDIRDKKRKLLRTRSIPPRGVGNERQLIMTEIQNSVQQSKQVTVTESRNLSHQTQVLSEVSTLKIESSTTISVSDAKTDRAPAEPQFQTIKEKECWHLYRRMCDKGVYVSFDTVLRGMLTPTEYRLRQKELTQDC
ncbi:uncharacterized protein LOC107263395 [Cephus cinctus]|uniref:Uncharacterized protein LOC107263395 n=1 Tax=Cephus cinctus TaxID=211228 RepID=A0AAJ7VXL2_CEPCN|nr:uncharacterized protein LOC107263395 [Cephus cinctus]XP_024936517.1 uncharacterized protein LOC107263395 [Cephus cinctus]XP_024936518.1 uncharacterized protein LOC107263395 [Cephus cinctus]